jgi:hypothetical protein
MGTTAGDVMTSELILRGFQLGLYGRRKCSECSNYLYFVKNIRGGRRPSGLRKYTDKTCSRKCSRLRTHNYQKRKGGKKHAKTGRKRQTERKGMGSEKTLFNEKRSSN